MGKVAPTPTLASRQRELRRKGKQGTRPSSSPSRRGRPPALVIGLAFVLIAGTWVVYSPVRNHVFVGYDDYAYVLNNPHVTAGLNWQTVRWALTSRYEANWHPVTWLSHALDCQWFGVNPGPAHMVSVAIHALNALLLFFLLQQATGAMGRSFVVAALFAWHPFNVESVAWIAERKNVLSTFFFLLTLGAYGWYVRKPGWNRRLLVICGFILALASKPMAVTLPFVLLLLDYWPLRRVAGWTLNSEQVSVPQESPARLVSEKWPLFALSAASSVVTLWAQKSGGAMDSLQEVPLGTRFSNALYSYVLYIWKALRPSGFAVLYPLPNHVAFWKPAIATLLLCAISIAVWKMRAARPYLVVGWLWFLGTLIPVIGIVQVGLQAMADRYAYVPLIGLFIMLVWGAAGISYFWRIPPWGSYATACLILGALAFVTSRQIVYWESNFSLWSHALSVTDENPTAEEQIASLLIVSGRTDLALPHLYAIARLNPRGSWTPMYLGTAYMAEGRIQDAAEQFEIVTQASEHAELNFLTHRYRSSSLLNLGIAYLRLREYPKALISFQRLNEFDPPLVQEVIEGYNRSLAETPEEMGYLKVSLLLRAEGKKSEASSLLDKVTKANPGYDAAQQLLSYLKSDQS